MAKDKGWIKLHRSIMENVVYDSPWTLKAFIHLCMTVNIKENKVNFDGKFYNIQPGQRITSTSTLAAEMKFSWRTVDKILHQFEDEEMIRIDKLGRAFIITIVNFKYYQSLLASRGESRDEVTNESTKPSRGEVRQSKKGKNELKNVTKESKEGARGAPLDLWGRRKR